MKGLDVGRVDDLWGLLYILVEMITGTLPWHKIKNKVLNN
jgi:hypothetical protein